MSELPEDVVKAGQDIVARLQHQTQMNQAKGMMEAFAAMAKEMPDFAQQMDDLNEALKAALPADLRARQEALDAEMLAIQAKGETMAAHPEVVARLQALLADPVYQKIIGDITIGEEYELEEAEDTFDKIDRLTLEALSPALREEYLELIEQIQGGNDDAPDSLREELSNRLNEIITCDEYLIAQTAANNKVFSEDVGLDVEVMLAAAPRNPGL